MNKQDIQKIFHRVGDLIGTIVERVSEALSSKANPADRFAINAYAIVLTMIFLTVLLFQTAGYAQLASDAPINAGIIKTFKLFFLEMWLNGINNNHAMAIIFAILSCIVVTILATFLNRRQ